jgi:hypothetical protein
VLFSAPQNTALALGRAVDVKITLPPQDGLIEVPLQGVYADRIVYTIEGDMLEAVEVERIVGVREDAEGNMSLLVRAEGLRPVIPWSCRRSVARVPEPVCGLSATMARRQTQAL